MAYAPVTVTGYNANPPEDDGSAVSTNEISWAGILAKIGTPLKNAIDAIQTAISAAVDPLDTSLKAPVGTVMIFRQTAAPTGWTKLTTHNDYALRCVTGTVGDFTTGLAFTTAFGARTIASANLPAHTHGFGTLAGTTDNPGNHSHTVSGGVGSQTVQSGVGQGVASTGGGNTGNNGGHSHVVTVTSGATGSTGSGTAMDFAVKYIDVIEAQKA